ncbi:MAG: glutamate--tRNA ligase [Chloroflexota bacterium]
MTVRVRFAPSPTGEPHIGNVRTVVFNWLFARKMGGQFILRIEDTDRSRYQPDTIQVIMDGLRWLGLDWDEGPGLESLQMVGVENAERYAVGGPYGPYIQSQRPSLYKEVAGELVARGWAYRCNCTPERLEQVRERQRAEKKMIMYDRHCRHLPPDAISPDEPHVIRLKVPLTGQTVVKDAIKGDVVFENAGIDDQILIKSDGFPTYHLAVVVDDHYMKISHVIRGDDWIPSTPKRILIYRAMGWVLPVYCHVPLVTGSDGKKLGKRHGATSVTEFRRQGYLPEALFNFLALLGWSPGEGEEQEIFSRQELIERFDLFRVNKAPAAFAYDKLDWLNGLYIRELPPDDLAVRLVPVLRQAGFDVDAGLARQLVPLVQERLKRLTDAVELVDFVFQDDMAYDVAALTGKKMTLADSMDALEKAIARLESLPCMAEEALEQTLRALADELNLKAGQLFGIIRVAVTGKQVSPPLLGSMCVLGRDRSLARMKRALRLGRSVL